jgi:ketosteroid isomerase-like protein
MKKICNVFFLFAIALTIGCNRPTEKPTPRTDSIAQRDSVTMYIPVSLTLYNEIRHADSVMFNAFNAQDVEALQATFSDSLEFYHDKGGVTGFAQTMLNFKGLFERNKTTGLRRVLVPGSLRVYPIAGYGAIETGEHQFCHIENGKNDCGIFKFLHLWKQQNGQWKVTRAVSYDH